MKKLKFYFSTRNIWIPMLLFSMLGLLSLFYLQITDKISNDILVASFRTFGLIILLWFIVSRVKSIRIISSIIYICLITVVSGSYLLTYINYTRIVFIIPESFLGKIQVVFGDKESKKLELKDTQLYVNLSKEGLASTSTLVDPEKFKMSEFIIIERKNDTMQFPNKRIQEILFKKNKSGSLTLEAFINKKN